MFGMHIIAHFTNFLKIFRSTDDERHRGAVDGAEAEVESEMK